MAAEVGALGAGPFGQELGAGGIIDGRVLAAITNHHPGIGLLLPFLPKFAMFTGIVHKRVRVLWLK